MIKDSEILVHRELWREIVGSDRRLIQKIHFEGVLLRAELNFGSAFLLRDVLDGGSHVDQHQIVRMVEFWLWGFGRVVVEVVVEDVVQRSEGILFFLLLL